jgi:hypothetical protein
MKMNPINPWLRFGAVMMIAGSAVSAMATDSSVIKLTLQNTGYDPDAAGSLISMLKSKSSVVKISASKLTPGQSYLLTVGDSAEAALAPPNRAAR